MEAQASKTAQLIKDMKDAIAKEVEKAKEVDKAKKEDKAVNEVDIAKVVFFKRFIFLEGNSR